MFRASHTHIAPGWRDLLRSQGLDNVAAVYQCRAGRVVASSETTEVRCIVLPDVGGVVRTLFVKKYWFASGRQRWRGMFRGTFLGRSKVRREYENLDRLRQWGLDAPAPIAYGEERTARWLVRSFLISEGVTDPTPLDHFIRRVLPALPPDVRRKQRRELIERLAACTRRLHERRFVHGDYFWRNIILSGTDLTRFHLIDAHKGRTWRAWTARRARSIDLAALDAPAPEYFRRTERLRFLLCYFQARRLTRPARALVHAVLRLAAPMRDRQLQRVGRAARGR